MSSFRIMVAALVAGTLAQGAWAEDVASTFQAKNRLRFEYDDNIYERNADQQDSLKIVEEIEFLVNLNLQQTFIGLRWRPTFVWWSERDPDDTDFHNDLDFILNHNFSPRVSLALKDTLRLAEQPDQIDRGTTVRERDDYLYNVTDGQLAVLLTPATRLEGGGRYTLLRYERDEVAEREDYDIVAGGVNLRREFASSLAVAGELRYEETSYDGPDRGSESTYAGVGLEHMFSPSLVAQLRGGAQMKSFNDADIDDETAPYADGTVTVLPSPATRLTAGVGYSLFEADVFPYANQERLLFFLSAAHDLTARLTLYAAGSYQMGTYNADQVIDPTAALGVDEDGNPITVQDGDEVVTQLSLRGSWKINRSNWLELGWQYLNLESDLREDYDRNRIEIGWRTQI